MDNQDRQVIEGLFARLGEVERQARDQDAGAEAFIKERIAQQPGAPYFMAQTIVMQDYALQQAQQRIEELERQQAERPAGGLLSSLFGGGQNAGTRRSATARTAAPDRWPPRLPRSPDAVASSRGRPRPQWASPAGYFSAMPSAVCLAATQPKPPKLLRPARQNLRPSQPPTSAAGSWTTSSTVATTKTDRGEPDFFGKVLAPARSTRPDDYVASPSQAPTINGPMSQPAFRGDDSE